MVTIRTFAAKCPSYRHRGRVYCPSIFYLLCALNCWLRPRFRSKSTKVICSPFNSKIRSTSQHRREFTHIQTDRVGGLVGTFKLLPTGSNYILSVSSKCFNVWLLPWGGSFEPKPWPGHPACGVAHKALSKAVRMFLEPLVYITDLFSCFYNSRHTKCKAHWNL